MDRLSDIVDYLQNENVRTADRIEHKSILLWKGMDRDVKFVIPEDAQGVWGVVNDNGWDLAGIRFAFEEFEVAMAELVKQIRRWAPPQLPRQCKCIPVLCYHSAAK